MKFLTKINRNYFAMLMFILSAVSVVGYFLLKVLIANDTKENLLEKEFLIKKQIAETGEIPTIYPIVEVSKITEKSVHKPVFKKIYIQNTIENETEPFLEYSNQFQIKNSYYSIKLRQSSFENEDLIFILALFLFILLLSAFGISFFMSKKMNKTIWADFEHNLLKIEQFNFNENKILNLTNSDIEEFDRLNKVVNNLTEKLITDYISLKEFSENASHEIQTPLSVILMNLEEVLQQNLNEETFRKVHSSINAAKRLSNLNQSLILLTKLENKQFKAENCLIINEIVQRKILEFESFFESKQLKVDLHNECNFGVKINEHLAELFIGNLLTNAVNHNVTGGSVQISIKEKELKICNTGLPNNLTNETIFNRFVKGNSKSFGLGLAIVKNICETHNLIIRYEQTERHCFIINSEI